MFKLYRVSLPIFLLITSFGSLSFGQNKENNAITYKKSCDTCVYEKIEAEAAGICVGRIEFGYQIPENGGTPKVENCRIHILEVDPDYRNKGIGTDLFKAAIEKMVAKGALTISWQASPFGDKHLTQEQLNAFYTRRGGVNEGNNHFVFTMHPVAQA